MTDQKRLFLAAEVEAPWLLEEPEGRKLNQASRHLTLAFFGQTSASKILQLLIEAFPQPNMKVAATGYFDKCLTLPPHHPNVVAYHAHFYPPFETFKTYQNQLYNWLQGNGYKLDDRPWLPHVTISRQPFIASQWTKAFTPLPFIIKAIHLYESTGNLNYVPIWSFPLQIAFEEIEHAADIAFNIFGDNLEQIYYNAFTALAFRFPTLIKYVEEVSHFDSLDDVIIKLNTIIQKADMQEGCPLKAISFHGEIISHEFLKWEMIVDV